MTRSLSRAVIKAGIINDDTLKEFQRWGLFVDVVQDKNLLSTPEEVVDYIREALEDGELVKVHEQDLDIFQRYVTQQRKGKIYVGKKSVDVTFTISKLGEYVIPWNQPEQMLMDDTSLRYTDDGGKRVRVSFRDVRELFFGDKKAFMVCTPSIDNGE